jgi:uncharacterized protein YcnI
VAVLLTLVLVLPPVAGGHLSVTPAFLTAAATQELAVTVHNDRDETMTGFALVVPAGFRIASISTTPGWSGGVEGSTATWTGGAVAADTPVTFELALEAPPSPGPAELRGDQLYPDGEVVAWPLEMTIVPASETGDDFSLTGVGFVGLVGLLALAAIGVLLLRRSRRSLQDQ